MGSLSRCSLRPVEPGDLPLFYEYQREPEARAITGIVPRERADFDAHWSKILADPAVQLRTIVFEGASAGHVCCFPRDGKHEVGYWVGRAYWGKGLASEATAALLREVSRRPLFAYVAKGNAASRRVAEKCGFTLAREVHSDGKVMLELRLSRGSGPASAARAG